MREELAGRHPVRASRWLPGEAVPVHESDKALRRGVGAFDLAGEQCRPIHRVLARTFTHPKESRDAPRSRPGSEDGVRSRVRRRTPPSTSSAEFAPLSAWTGG